MKHLLKKERGFTLIEVLISMALLGMIATAFLVAVSTAAKATFITDERATAESIARSQLEYIKQQQYSPADPGGEASYNIIDIDDIAFPGYTLWNYSRSSGELELIEGDEEEGLKGIPWDNQAGGYAVNDIGLKKVIIVVMHHGEAIITIESLKAER